MIRTLLVAGFFCFFRPFAQAQSPPAGRQAYVEVGALGATTNRTPFWLRANQFGVVPLTGQAGTVRAGLSGSFMLTDTTVGRYRVRDKSKQAVYEAKRPWWVGYGAEFVSNAANPLKSLLPEAYVSLNHRQLEIVAGRRREVIGLGDTLLTSGFYAWSGNALPVPKVRIGTRGFVSLGKSGRFAINAYMAHGWFGNTWYMQGSYLHQKSVFLRVGKPSARIQATGGLNHQAQWGGYTAFLPKEYAVDGQLPNKLVDFPNVFAIIRIGGRDNSRITSFDYYNLYGNHLGSWDLQLDVRLNRAQLKFYHQHGFDDSSGILFINFPDGLYGVSYTPTVAQSGGFRVKRALFEFLTTLQQSGANYWKVDPATIPDGEKWTAVNKGDDNYFNNGQYQEGWTYQGQGLGTPFITNDRDVRPEFRNQTTQAYSNNRVVAFHTGLWATVANKIDLRAKLSVSLNYGLMHQPFPGTPVQGSALVQAGVPVGWLGSTYLTGSLAADVGQLYTNSLGVQLGLRKTVGL